MHKYFTYLLTAIGCYLSMGNATISAQQLLPPEMGCTKFLTNGDVEIFWLPVSDPGNNFTSYEVFASSNPLGSFVSIGSVNIIGTSNFVYPTGIDPATVPFYFYLVTHSTDGVMNYVSDPSIVIGTIFLTAVPSTNPLGYASLSWNSPFPSLGTEPTGVQYDIWMQRGPNWSLLMSVGYGTNNLNYEIKEMCDEQLSFQVRIVTAASCEFYSNTSANIYRDIIPPDIPLISSVSIDMTTADAVITWEPSFASDTQGYLVYRCQGTTPPTTTLIGTIMGSNNTQFIDLPANTAIGPVQYAIAAFDFCYLLTPPMVPASPIGPCNKSIFLEAPSYTTCDDFIRINWQHYEGWNHGIDTYKIFHGFSTSAPDPSNPISFSEIATVSGNANSYIHHGIPQQDGFNVYYIEGHASQTGYTATSNSRVIFVSYPAPPAYIYLGSVSVINNDSTRITVDVSPTTLPHEFRLQRFGINSNEWMDIDLITAASTSSIQFIDDELSNNVFSYQYRVVVTNGCGDIVDTTNIGRNIVADGVANTDLFMNLLNWTAYEDWYPGVSTYKIYREIDDNGIEEMIGEINGSSNRYFEDDVSDLLFTNGKFCYRVEAAEAAGSPSGIAHTAFSNEICVNQEPVIWIPNSFYVGGVNERFGPTVSFANFETYRMVIYSRWGDVVYDTNDITAPWDGSFKGKTAQQGTYVYWITIKDGLGRGIEKRGYVNMLVYKAQP